MGRASVVALLLAASPAVAAERVALLLPSCELPGVTAAELREAVALDLQSEGLVLAAAGELSPGRDVELLVEASCPAPDALTLHAELAAERQRRSVRLSELAIEQRPRALSLALTELVSLVLHPAPPPVEPPSIANELEKEVPPAPPAPPPPPPPPAPSASLPVTALRDAGERAPRAMRKVWRLGLAPELRFFDETPLWGAQAQVERERWRFGAGLLTSKREVPVGEVTTRLVHAKVGYGLPLWGEPEASALESGPRIGFGYTFLGARASDLAVSYDARDWYLDAAWTARFVTVVSAAVRLGLGAELGYGRGPIGYADNAVIARTSGLFASTWLEASLRLE